MTLDRGSKAMFGSGSSAEKRLQQGTGKSARAQIVDARKGHWITSSGGSDYQQAHNARVTWTLRLRVMPADEQPFDVTIKRGFHVGAKPTINSVVNVLYDQSDHSKVVFDDTPPKSKEERLQRALDGMDPVQAEKMRQKLAAGQQSMSAPFAQSTPSAADEIEKLALLRDRGVLTDVEFEVQKRKILGM
jgi:hypothetical protein